MLLQPSPHPAAARMTHFSLPAAVAAEPVRAATGFYVRVKVVVDFVLAVLLLIPALPLLILAAVLVKLTSRGPVIYSQVRLGKGGRPYKIYKVRTMVHNCERQSGACWSVAGDPRITRLGRFLRRTHLDELPQLWNVLCGDMSLVGPRPERPEFVPSLAEALPGYRDRLAVRPGVTGLAQVQLPADSDLDSVRRKLACDLHYIRRVSFWLDLRLILCTVTKVLGVPFRIPQALLRLPAAGRIAGGPVTAAALQPRATLPQPMTVVLAPVEA